MRSTFLRHCFDVITLLRFSFTDYEEIFLNVIYPAVLLLKVNKKDSRTIYMIVALLFLLLTWNRSLLTKSILGNKNFQMQQIAFLLLVVNLMLLFPLILLLI